MSSSPHITYAAYEAFGLSNTQERDLLILNFMKFAHEWGFDDFCRYMKYVKKIRYPSLVSHIDDTVTKLTVIAPKLISNSGNIISIWDFYSDSASEAYVWRNNRRVVFEALESDFCVVPIRKEHFLIPKPITPRDYDYGIPKKRQSEAVNALDWQPDVDCYQGRHAPFCHLGIHMDIRTLRTRPIWPITPAVAKQLFYRPQAMVPSRSVFPMLVAGVICETKQKLAS